MKVIDGPEKIFCTRFGNKLCKHQSRRGSPTGCPRHTAYT